MFLKEAVAQGSERLRGAIGGNGQRRFRRSVIGGSEEAADPGNCRGAIQVQDAVVAGAEDFRFVAGKNRLEAKQKCGGG